MHANRKLGKYYAAQFQQPRTFKQDEYNNRIKDCKRGILAPNAIITYLAFRDLNLNALNLLWPIWEFYPELLDGDVLTQIMSSHNCMNPHTKKPFRSMKEFAAYIHSVKDTPKLRKTFHKILSTTNIENEQINELLEILK